MKTAEQSVGGYRRPAAASRSWAFGDDGAFGDVFSQFTIGAWAQPGRYFSSKRDADREHFLGLVEEFRLILRQSSFNPLDFSVILAWIPAQSTSPFRLCRYNGKSHEHTNALDSQKFYDFHVHRATERYQQLGLREDSFAEPTSRYQDFTVAQGAVKK